MASRAGRMDPAARPWPLARLVRQRVQLPVPLALAAVAITVAVTGCATAPSGGPPRSAPGGSNQVQAYVQQLPAPGPTSKWTPTEVVLGFLHAGASYVFDPAAAEQYLVPATRKQWQPGLGPVAVVGAPTGFTTLPYHPQILGPVQAAQVEVQFTGQHLATLSQTGQYQYAPAQNVRYDFVLEKSDDVWLIEQLPSLHTLVLTESDFEDVYQPRNLFFYAPPAAGQAPSVLVPDPVYAPLQSSNSALNTDLATGLVNGLLKGQGGWLSGATVSAFPRGTRLLKKVVITGRTAEVDLGGAAVHAQFVTVQQMAAQLLATLSDGEYSQPLATRLELYIGKTPQDVVVQTGLVTPVATGPVLFVSSTGSVDQLPPAPRSGVKPLARLGPDQLGQVTATAVAASPNPDRPQQLAVAVPNGNGCAVELKPASQSSYRSYPLSQTGGPCTSLSWDNNGNLWVVAGSSVWLFRPNQGPDAVNLSALSTALRGGGSILALRMAPDAVRAALLVKTTAGTKLLLAAVRLRAGAVSLGQPVSVGVGLTDPLAISWYDAYHLAVLATGGIYDVPLTGGAGQQPGAAPYLFTTAPPGAETLTTDGAELVVGTSQGQVYAGSVSAPGWSLVANGTDPIYPG